MAELNIVIPTPNCDRAFGMKRGQSPMINNKTDLTPGNVSKSALLRR